MRVPDGIISDITPDPFSARTRVHEYGGGAFLVHQGVVFFSNYSDQRLYRQDPGENPQPMTSDAGLRYADGCFDVARNRIVCVREDSVWSSLTWKAGRSSFQAMRGRGAFDAM